MNQDFTKITLLGYMGSGKSTIARILGGKLDLPAIDLDDYIEAREGLSIPEIFATRGEIYFRKKEHVHLLELMGSDQSFVLALGGGTPCYANNMSAILERSDSYYLKASISTLSNRLLKEQDHRPLIADLDEEQLTEFIAKHLFERRNFYEMAGSVISIDGKTSDEIAQEIIQSR